MIHFPRIFNFCYIFDWYLLFCFVFVPKILSLYPSLHCSHYVRYSNNKHSKHNHLFLKQLQYYQTYQHRKNLFSILNDNKNNDLWDTSYLDSEYTPEYETSYVAAAGLESMIISVGNRRPLMQVEYQMAFHLFPKLSELSMNCINAIKNTTNYIPNSDIWPLRTKFDENSAMQSTEISSDELEAMESEITIIKKGTDLSVDVEAEQVLARSLY